MEELTASGSTVYKAQIARIPQKQKRAQGVLGLKKFVAAS